VLRRSARIELLRRVPLFEHCSQAELRRIAQRVDELALPAGRRLTREGDPAREFLVLVGGSAEVSQRGKRLRVLGGGDFLGELALVAGTPRTATVTALTPVEVLRLTARDFRALMRDVPSLQLKVLQALASRLDEPEFV